MLGKCPSKAKLMPVKTFYLFIIDERLVGLGKIFIWVQIERNTEKYLPKRIVSEMKSQVSNSDHHFVSKGAKALKWMWELECGKDMRVCRKSQMVEILGCGMVHPHGMHKCAEWSEELLNRFTRFGYRCGRIGTYCTVEIQEIDDIDYMKTICLKQFQKMCQSIKWRRDRISKEE